MPIASPIDGFPVIGVEELLGEGAHHRGEDDRAPASQPRIPGRWIVTARPSGLRSRALARASPAPPRTRALPRSRRAASRTASPTEDDPDDDAG